MPRPRVLVADDHLLVGEGLCKLLESDFELLGLAQNGRVLVSEARKLKPDLIVLDVAMPLLNGIEAARQIRRFLPEVKLVFVSQQLGQAYVHAAFAAGASAYVSKQSASSELRSAIREVLKGGSYITPILDRRSTPSGPHGRELTPRQREVLQLIALGKTRKEIASLLSISPKTVEFHKASIMDELNLRTTAELTLFAMQEGLVA
jgi:DNA-binding NarL/FixJ family response regulator